MFPLRKFSTENLIEVELYSTDPKKEPLYLERIEDRGVLESEDIEKSATSTFTKEIHTLSSDIEYTQ